MISYKRGFNEGEASFKVESEKTERHLKGRIEFFEKKLDEQMEINRAPNEVIDKIYLREFFY